MATQAAGAPSTLLTREKLVELLNEDLSREYQAIIAYVNYSQVLKGAEYMSIASELEKQGVKVDARGEYLRLCPDILSPRRELESAAATLKGLLGASTPR